VQQYSLTFAGPRTAAAVKVFWSGRSQAVRLPRAFRVDAGEVRIRRRGRAIVLEPVLESWEWLDALAEELDDDFVSAVREQPDAMERPGLSRVFR
jgi:antitoxin VapB